MARYNIGDKVLIVPKWNRYTQENPDGYMDDWLNTVMTIGEVDEWYDRYRMIEDHGRWSWNKYCIVGLADVVKSSIRILIEYDKKLEIAYQNPETGEIYAPKGSIII